MDRLVKIAYPVKMHSYTLRHSGLQPEQALQKWKSHGFYQKDIVLGIDIGLKGIGVCVRRGPEIIYAKTWMVDLPAAQALADRRAKRAGRHCRENRKVRLSRLKQLFATHGLPWFEEQDPALLRTDPYLLRHRAITSQLATREALSLAIRNIVQHRGYDYQYFNDEGAYPWGDATEFKAVRKELQNLWIMSEDAANLVAEVETFGWKEAEMAEFESLLASRIVQVSQDPIRLRLAAHAAQKRTHLRQRAKGEAFPRALVWNHLREIVERHAHLLEDATGFLAALAVRPQEEKNRAIFYYHRKTPEEMRKHFENKVRRCRYAPWLGMEVGLRCAERGHPAIQKFFLLEFLAARRIELADESRSKAHLPVSVISLLLTWQQAHQTAYEQRAALPKWGELRKQLVRESEAHYGYKIVSESQSEFNKSFFTTLRDLVCPTAANRKQRASMSEAAAVKLTEKMTAGGLEPEALRQSLRELGYYDYKRGVTLDEAGIYPQVEFLLGRRAKKSRMPTKRHPNRCQAGELAVKGRLQQLFAELAPKLGGQTHPDCCIVEVIGDPPRNQKQATELAKEMEERRSHRDDIFKRHEVAETGSRSIRLRLKLWEQQAGHSPFTGHSLGADPLSPDLEIEHLFPQSRGGLWVEENLVLTHRSENQRKNNRTPREASTDLAGSWTTMLQHSAAMKWSARKRAIFEWAEASVPDFGNTTRMSQLARQLTAEIARWIGIEEIRDDNERENQRALRIATPSGYLTATARAAWQMPRKDRKYLAHHLVDAVTLAHIPPREGLNSVACGGIFHNQLRQESGKMRLTALPLGPAPAEIESLVAPDAEACAIMHFRKFGSRASRHDQTLLAVAEDGKLSSREPLLREGFGRNVENLQAALLGSGIPQALLPSRSSLEAWLLAEGADDKPLRLLNGSPVTRVRTINTKENFAPPFGLTAKANEHAQWQGVKIISGKFAGATLMRRWVGPKGKKPGAWRFYVQRVPDRKAMESLLRLGFAWFTKATRQGLQPSPPAETEAALRGEMRRLQDTPKHWAYLTVPHIARRTLHRLMSAGFLAPMTWETVEKAIWGAEQKPGDLPVLDPNTRHPCLLKNGDVFRLRVTGEGKRPEPGAAYVLRWYRISAIQTNGKIAFSSLQESSASKIMYAAESLAALFNALSTDDPPPDSGAG